MRFHLSIGLLAASATVTAAIAGPAAQGPIIKDGVEIIILPRIAPADGPDVAVEVGLDLEARADDAVHRLGFRSLHGVTAIDCRTGANRFISAEAFGLADLKGPGRPRPISGKWVRPDADSYMAEVTRRMCSEGGALVAAVPAATVTAGTGESVPSPPDPTRVVPPSGGSTAAPAAAPAISATAAVQATKPASPASRAVAQVSASPTAQGAQRVLNGLGPVIAPPLTGLVETAVVNGATVFRASISGFATAEDARAFCTRVISVTRTCWVRLKPLHPVSGRTR